MEERRRFVRLETQADVAYIVLPDGTTKRTRAKDVSAGGLRLATDRRLAAGTQLQIAMALPGSERPVNAIAEVVWSQQYEVVGKGDRQQSVEIGARFAEIAPQDQETITRFIATSLQ